MIETPLARRPRAVVCAYHNVGVRCLAVLLAGGVDVALVLSHADSPNETIWFDSVAELAARHGIPVITPEDPNTPEVRAAIAAVAPDFLFSFYYRAMLAPELLALAPRGALNMHGSLLPRYRGRVPVNWAVIRGERETGASLHYMSAKPDQGDVVGRQRVPILPDDTAFEVFQKVTWAAELLLEQSLPALLAGTAPREVQRLAEGNYCGGRKPADGVIDWQRPLAEVHNLVRGVAPPYPGAFTELGGLPARILRTQLHPGPPAGKVPVLLADPAHGLWVEHPAGGRLRILALELEGAPADAAAVHSRLGGVIPLTL
jgi:methionyl-tRNA formyltransferase